MFAYRAQYYYDHRVCSKHRGGVFEGQSSSISSQRGGGGGANRGGPLGGMGPREENNY